MGYMRHHAIIVTTWNGKLLRKARKIATRIFEGVAVSEILDSGINGYMSFFIPPDGSKEGWDQSDLGDERRERFTSWLDAQRYEDGSTSLDWVEVQYGDECGKTIVIRDGDEYRRERITDAS